MSDMIKALVKQIKDLDVAIFEGSATEKQLSRYDILLDIYEEELQSLDTSLLDPSLDITGNGFKSSVL